VLGRVLLLAFVATILATLYGVGFFELIQKPAEVREGFRALGDWGPVLYVVSFALLEPFFVPGFAFMLPGAFVWDYPRLFLYSWLGATGAGITGFAFARYIGRDYVQRHMPERIRRYDVWLSDAGLRGVILLRLVLFILPPANWLLGLSRVRFSVGVVGTAIGFIPGMAVITYVLSILQAEMFEWLEANTRAFLIGTAILVVLFGVYRLVSVRRAGPAPSAESEPGEESDADEADRGA
jgi:uncharacterized membrane protein YdjX (TVP38/TMEM64 family)